MQQINSKMVLLLLAKWAAKTHQTNKQKSSELGLTLLEVLIGILIISVVVVASTPSLILGVATRVQARRAEEAFNLAQQQVQQIELLVEQGKYLKDDLPKAANITNNQDPKEAPAPTSFCSTCTKYSDPTATQLFKLDQDSEYLVQVFRSPGKPEITSNDNPPVAFNLGVRVYFQSAQSQLDSGGTLETTRASLNLTSGEGSIRTRPLAVLYLPICQPVGSDAIDNCNGLLTTPPPTP